MRLGRIHLQTKLFSHTMVGLSNLDPKKTNKRSVALLAGAILLVALAFFHGSALAAPVEADAAATVVRGWLAADPAPPAENLSPKIKGVVTSADAQGGALYY